MIAAAALLAIAQATAPLPAPPPPPARTAAPLSIATADRLLAIVLPLEQVIGEHRRAHREALAERIADDPALAKLQAAKPGFRPAVEAEFDKLVTATYRRLAPALMTDVRAIYRRTLTEAEGAELVSIFSTPTGRKLVSAMHRGSADSGSLTPDGIGNDGRAAALGALGPEDRPTLERIARQPALMNKMRGAAQPIRDASNRFIEQATAALIDTLPATLDRVAKRFREGS